VRNFKRRLLTIGVVGAAACGAVAFAATSADEPAKRFNKETGEINVELMPSRIKIGTDLYKVGYGWLDNENFKDESTGPFMVFESEDSKDPAYWYYKGSGIVPIGTSLEEAQKMFPLSSVAIDEDK
jgi:polyisoprenoid-binding protein YceI